MPRHALDFSLCLVSGEGVCARRGASGGGEFAVGEWSVDLNLKCSRKRYPRDACRLVGSADAEYTICVIKRTRVRRPQDQAVASLNCSRDWVLA